MTRALELTGRRFGSLVVLSATDRRLGQNIVWLCNCDCGNQTMVGGSNLKRGNTKSCGCGRVKAGHPNLVDITGKRYGRYVVLGRNLSKRNSRGDRAYWECRCDCGKEVAVLRNSLVRGLSKSCGCLRDETTRANFTTHGLSKTPAYNVWQHSKRRARKQSSISEHITPSDIARLFSKETSRCYYCGDNFEHVDHFVPLSRGGAHALRNLVPSCAHCNLSKHNRLVGTEWIPPMVQEWT